MNNETKIKTIKFGNCTGEIMVTPIGSPETGLNDGRQMVEFCLVYTDDTGNFMNDRIRKHGDPKKALERFVFAAVDQLFQFTNPKLFSHLIFENGESPVGVQYHVHAPLIVDQFDLADWNSFDHFESLDDVLAQCGIKRSRS